MIDVVTAKSQDLFVIDREPGAWVIGLDTKAPASPRQCRVTIYEPPRPGRTYALGSDHAYGIEDRDYDTCCVLDKTAQTEHPHRARQVVQVRARLGEQFERVLYVLHVWYNEAFMVGERQVGLSTYRRLRDEYGVTHMYFERDEAVSNRKMKDKLCYVRTAGDVAMRNFRRAVADDEVDLRDPELLDEMSRLVWQDKRLERTGSDKDSDEALGVQLVGGGSPDLVISAAMAWHGIREVQHYEQYRTKKYPPGTYGDIFGFAEVFGEVMGGVIPEAMAGEQDAESAAPRGISWVKGWGRR